MSDGACSCELEDAFGVYESDGRFDVYDSEMTLVATSVTKKYAELIAWALNRSTSAVGNQCCILHTKIGGK